MVCRAENNRYYLRRGIEVRPGYLARWIQFSLIDKDGNNDIADMLRERQAAAIVETQKNVELDHMRFMDGINRNLNSQAIDLRIQIEESKLNRPLTAVEKQDIVNSQLERPITNMQQRGPVGRQQRAMTAAAPNTKPVIEEESSSSSVSSDWDDWKDPEYIEEQRKALQEFSKIQRDIKTSHSTKKKKKKSKKKKNRLGTA